jgi:ketosteroid isomerase-like protein
MKRLLILTATGFFSMMVCQAQNTKPVQAANATSMGQLHNGPVHNISIGNMMYAQKVIQLWKDYDNNTMDNVGDLLADDVVATFPDGSMVKGKDNFVKMIKDYRNSFSSVSSTIMACTTLKSPDDPEHEVVSVWGEENDTSKDGTTVKTHLNEVWFFNKQGKVVMFHQMAAKDAMDKKN